MDAPLPVIGAVVIVVALAGIFFVSLAEAALVAVHPLVVRRRAERGDERARIIRQLRQSGHYLTALIVSMNAGIILISTITTVMAAHLFPADASTRQELLHIGMIAVIVVISELTPKTYGSLFAEPVALRVARPVQRLTHVLGPVTRVLMAVSQALFNAVGTGLERRAELMTPGQIRVAAELGAENGQVTQEETEMLESVMALTDTTAREVMVPRLDIVALPLTAPIDQVISTALSSGHSRIPVYEKEIDQVVGIFYVHDLLATPAQNWDDLQLHEIMREPVLVPESKCVDEILWMMREQSTHLAVVIDEFGSTAGLVTIEDILEELVGEIEDEHDFAEPEIELLSVTEALVDGRAHIEDVNKALGTELPEDEYETVAGLVSAVAGHIPEPGDVITYRRVQFIVQEGDEQQIERLQIVVPPEGGG